jgi:RING-variant domain
MSDLDDITPAASSSTAEQAAEASEQPRRKSQSPRWTTAEALSKRLPGQPLPPDPFLEQPNAADLTYGWHEVEENGSSSEEQAASASSENLLRRRTVRRRRSSGTGSSNAEGHAQREGAEQEAEAGPSRPTADTSPENKNEGTNSNNQAESDAEAEEYLRNQQNQVICRICFEGPGSRGEEGQDLGRLISPCKCKGTMKVLEDLQSYASQSWY